MSVGSVMIGLQASHRDGRGVATSEFLLPLDIQPDEVAATRADGGEWASGMVFFAVVRFGDYAHIDTAADAGAQTEAFYEGVVESFRAVGRFFDQRSPAVTETMRNAGLSLRLLIEVGMNQDQMELELPSELLASCGRHRLGVYIISNDIPATEVVEAIEGRTSRST